MFNDSIAYYDEEAQYEAFLDLLDAHELNWDDDEQRYLAACYENGTPF